MGAVGAMDMAVRNFFGRGGAHGHHLAGKPQRLAGQRVVAVEVHLGALDLDHVEHLRLAVIAHALQLAAHLHTGRKLALGDGAHQRLIARAKGVFHGKVERGGEPCGPAFQRGLHLREDVLISAVQIGQMARVQRFALRRGHRVAEGDGGVFADVHAAFSGWQNPSL